MDSHISTYRRSMFNNPLLQRARTAKRLRFCIRLPGENFTYGMKNICLDGGVAEALSNWHEGEPSPGKPRQKNFVKMNYNATRYRKTSTTEQKLFREEHCKGEKYLLPLNKGFGQIKIPDIVFGKPNKFDEDLSLIIQNGYFHRWFEKMKKRENYKRSILPPPNFVKENKLNNRIPVQLPPISREKPWKMSRFLKAGHRVDCWNRYYGFKPTSIHKPIIVDEELMDKKPCMCDEHGPPINMDDVLETTYRHIPAITKPVFPKIPSLEEKNSSLDPVMEPIEEKSEGIETLRKWMLPPRSPSVPTSKLMDEYRVKKSRENITTPSLA